MVCFVFWKLREKERGVKRGSGREGQAEEGSGVGGMASSGSEEEGK